MKERKPVKSTENLYDTKLGGAEYLIASKNVIKYQLQTLKFKSNAFFFN